MVLAVRSNVSYLSETKVSSRVGGDLFLAVDTSNPTSNGAVLNISHIIKAVITSASESELGTLFINALDGIP